MKFRMPRQGSVNHQRLPEIPRNQQDHSITLTNEMATEYESLENDDPAENTIETTTGPDGKKTTRTYKRHPTTNTVWRRRRSHDLKKRMLQATFHEIYTG